MNIYSINSDSNLQYLVLFTFFFKLYIHFHTKHCAWYFTVIQKYKVLKQSFW
jgi:hypothetical protein